VFYLHNLLGSGYRGRDRGETDDIKKGGYGNVISIRSLPSRLQAWSSTYGNSHYYESDSIDVKFQEFLNTRTFDQQNIDKILRDFGDIKYYEFADVPFFLFPLAVMYDPEVVQSWTYPGTASAKTSHWNLIKRVQ